MARLLSVNVGLPRDIEWKGRTVHTGIWKNPVRGRCRVGRESTGEVKATWPGTGVSSEPLRLPDRIVSLLAGKLKRIDFVTDSSAENFTIEGLPDDAFASTVTQPAAALFEVTNLALPAIELAFG